MPAPGRLQLSARLDRLCRTDPFVAALAAAASGSGSRLLLVGGVLRDLRAGQPPRDADFILMGPGRKRFLRALPALAGSRVVTFRKRGIVDHRVVAGGREHDLVEVTSGSLARELARRDFTMNAVAWDVGRRALVDPRGGLGDMARGRIVANSDRVFRDDPLRMLRAARFAAELGFGISRATVRWIRRDAALLARTSPERIRDELDRILASPRSSRGLRQADRLGLLSIAVPEIERLRGLVQNRYHHLDAWEHTLSALDAASDLAALGRSVLPARAAAFDRERVLVLRWALLFHDLGKAETRTVGPDGEVHFFGHEKASARLAGRIMKRLRFTTRRARAIRRLVELHLRVTIPAEGELSAKAVRRLIRDAGELTPLLALHSLADKSASHGRGWRGALVLLRRTARGLVRVWKESGAAILAPPRLVDGHDVMQALGTGPGPRVGKALQDIRDRQIAGEISTREEALALLESPE